MDLFLSPFVDFLLLKPFPLSGEFLALLRDNGILFLAIFHFFPRVLVSPFQQKDNTFLVLLLNPPFCVLVWMGSPPSQRLNVL